MATGQLELFRRPVVALLAFKTLCGEEPAVWEWMECVRAFMPRDSEGYAMIDSRDLAEPKLHNTPWGRRWDK